MLEFLVAQKNLSISWQGEPLDLTSSTFTDTEREQFFTDRTLLAWLANFRGKLILPLTKVFAGDDPSLLALIGSQRHLELTVSAPFGAEFIQKVNDFQGGYLALNVHNIHSKDEALLRGHRKVWLNVVSRAAE